MATIGEQIYLNRTEVRILEKLREGYESKEIARMINLNYHTLKFYLLLIRAKLNARNTCNAVVKAIRLHLISLNNEDE